MPTQPRRPDRLCDLPDQLIGQLRLAALADQPASCAAAT
jgi:hypothetical protein